MNRYELYERAVQSVENDLDLIERAFAIGASRSPETLREDFAGTAALSRAWVESDPDRHAIAVDIDETVLAYAAARRSEMLDEEAARLTLARRDVREASEIADVIVAMNFSWAVLPDDALIVYLRHARSSLAADGVLLLELFGGEALTTPGADTHDEGTFVYRFARDRYDEASAILDASLHFESHRGEPLVAPFRYGFHLRSLDAIDRLARDAGFERRQTWIEDRKGRYRTLRGRPRASSFRGLVILSG